VKSREEISITLADGAVKTGKAWETTPASIAGAISKSMLERTVIALVDGELWDLDRPFEASCKLELLDFSHPEGLSTPLPNRYALDTADGRLAKKVFWHSSAHILGEAAEKQFGCYLCNGPPTTDPPGFYYDMANMDRYVSVRSDCQGMVGIPMDGLTAK
jgi:threonyl-tRNA synthetase